MATWNEPPTDSASHAVHSTTNSSATDLRRPGLRSGFRSPDGEPGCGLEPGRFRPKTRNPRTLFFGMVLALPDCHARIGYTSFSRKSNFWWSLDFPMGEFTRSREKAGGSITMIPRSRSRHGLIRCKFVPAEEFSIEVNAYPRIQAAGSLWPPPLVNRLAPDDARCASLTAAGSLPESFLKPD